MCERASHNQFTSYLLWRDHRSSKQGGNKQWHSTETSVIRTTDEILSAIYKKKLTAVVLFDLSKAFDSINHQIHPYKVTRYWRLLWFHSYLASRCQVVRIHAALSDRLPVACGVPQGSILGTLLFSIHLNDLSAVPRNCLHQLYVHDTKLLMSFLLEDQRNVTDDMNRDLLPKIGVLIINCSLTLAKPSS